MTEQPSPGGLCTSCGKQLEAGDASTAPYCAQCAAVLAEQDLDSRQAASARNRPDEQHRARSKQRARAAAFWLLGIAAVAVIVWRAPLVYSAVQPPAPIRIGAQSTNGPANECISNLWTAAGRLPEGTNAADGLTCPASGRPYFVSGNGTAIVISCPNPEKHGLRTLSVSSRTLVPEVK